jgi:glycine/D-amino acid oxidase-like deaminating enzyme
MGPTSFKEQPFWADTLQMPAGSAQPLPEKVDVAVVGAGFTGLSAARTLAQRRVRVAVLEAESIGWGASSRNGGMVLTGLKLGVEELREKYGDQAARRMFAASVASIDCVERIVKEENISCDFERCGHLEVAWKKSHFERFRRSADILEREFNYHVDVVPQLGLDVEIGSKMFYGGLVDHLSAGVNPARYVSGLARAAQRAGAEIHDRCRVEKIERLAGEGGAKPFRVTTSRGALVANEVFIATGGYTTPVTPAIKKRVIPIGSFIIVTEPLSEELAARASPRNRMIYDSKNFLWYWRLTPDRRMLFGGRAAFFPETPRTIRRSAEILRKAMLQTYPYLRETRTEYAWGGTLDFTFDVLPHAGTIDGMHYAIGYAGHGVAMATYLGQKMAEQMAGARDANPFLDVPFPGAPLGLYSGTPWFLPLAGAYYKLKDWLS